MPCKTDCDCSFARLLSLKRLVYEPRDTAGNALILTQAVDFADMQHAAKVEKSSHNSDVEYANSVYSAGLTSTLDGACQHAVMLHAAIRSTFAWLCSFNKRQNHPSGV